MAVQTLGQSPDKSLADAESRKDASEHIVWRDLADQLTQRIERTSQPKGHEFGFFDNAPRWIEMRDRVVHPRRCVDERPAMSWDEDPHS